MLCFVPGFSAVPITDFTFFSLGAIQAKLLEEENNLKKRRGCSEKCQNGRLKRRFTKGLKEEKRGLKNDQQIIPYQTCLCQTTHIVFSDTDI